MGLGVSARATRGDAAIVRRLADIEVIAGLQTYAGPLAAGLSINDLDFDIEVIGLFQIRNGCLVVRAPFLATAVEDIEAIRADRNDLAWPHGRTGIGPT